MKKIIPALLIVATCCFTSCFQSKKTVKDDAVMSKGLGTEGGNGTSFDDAVVVLEKNQTEGVAAEYDWLKMNYPGYSLVKTDLQYNNNTPYDVMVIKTADGSTKTIYFDITAFFGKF